MKVTRPKTLLVSLLGCAFVAAKAPHYAGLPDLFWLLFIGFLSVRGLIAAFSQKARDENARKRPNRRRSVILGVLVLLGIFDLTFGDPQIYLHNARLKHTLSALECGSTTLEEIVPFAWTAVYTFDPYTPVDRIERIVGAKSPALRESVSEGMTHVVFTDKGRITASVCAYPASIGYDLEFTGGKASYYNAPDVGYSRIEYGDAVVFAVTQEDGFVRLYARAAK